MRIASFCAAGYLCFAMMFAAQGLAAAPPLQPNEEVVKTLDGCGMVIDASSPGAKYTRDAISKLTWGGACVDGLAMGEGIVGAGVKLPNQPAMLPTIGWVWYGRFFGPMETRWDNGGVQQNFTWDGKNVFYRSLDSEPVWSETHSEASQVGDGQSMVRTLFMGKPEPSASVSVYENGNSQLLACPKKGSSKGCEALWRQHAGPVIQRIKLFLAENEPKAKLRVAEVQELVAQWKAQVGPDVVAKREADAKRAVGEAFAAATKEAAWTQGCYDKMNKGPGLFDQGPTSQVYAKRAQFLRDLFKGECAGHPYATYAFQEADRLMADVPKYASEEQRQGIANAKLEKDESAQREKNRQETGALLGAVAGALITGKNSAERQQGVIDVLNKTAEGNTGQKGSGTAARAGTGASSSTSTKPGESREIGPVPTVARTEAVSDAAAAITDNRDIDKTVCEAAVEYMGTLAEKTSAADHERYGWLMYPGTNSRVEYERSRFDIEFLRTCAKDTAEFKEKSYYANENFQRHRTRVEPCRGGYRDDEIISMKTRVECDKIPPGFDEWFARYRNNAAISLEWARRSLANPNPEKLYAYSKEAKACKAQIDSLEARRRNHESKLQKDEIVRLSELTMWFINEANAIIESTCPKETTYLSYRDHGLKQYPELMRVCNQMASRECAPREPTEPKITLTNSRPPPPPLQSQETSACSAGGAGASSVKCLVDECKKQGGDPVVGTCVTCRGTATWTECPAGSGGVSSRQ